MRVYVESNFVLELVLEQEQHQSCERLSQLCSDGAIQIASPAYAFVEPYQTLIRRRKDRKEMQRLIQLERSQLGRTASLAADVSKLQDAHDLLVRASQDQFDRFKLIRGKLLADCEVLALDSESLVRSDELLSRLNISLEYPDAVIFTAVYLDALDRAADQSLFLNRNSKDFIDDPDVKMALNSVGCTVIANFDDGLARVLSSLGLEA